MVAVTVHIVLTRSKPSLTFRTLVTPDILIVRGSLAEAIWILLVSVGSGGDGDGGRVLWLVFALALTRVFAHNTLATFGLALARAVLADEVIPFVHQHTVVVVVAVSHNVLIAHNAPQVIIVSGCTCRCFCVYVYV